MTRRMLQQVCWMVFGAMLALSVGSQAAPAVGADETTDVERPTTAIDPANCVTSKCHGEVVSYTVLHAPVIARTCDACHLLTSAKDHTFKLMREKADLCTFCHEFSTGMLPVIHKPVITGQCLGCHNPHGGRDHTLTREATTAQLCGRCHDSVTYGKRFLHDPEKEGDCTACHRPHASKYPNLLDAVGDKLCYTCHSEMGKRMGTVKFTHQAMKDGCTDCHATHGSWYPMELTQPVAKLCLGCHKEIKTTMTGATYEHPAAQGERACLSCHTPHGGNLAFLMCDQPVRICKGCHKEKVEANGGELMTAMLRFDDPTRFQHTPVREGDCGGCHTIHGGDKAQLLYQSYSTQFHQPFSPEEYELCFDCHDQRIIEKEKTDKLTKFRDGDVNLHFLHVMKGGEFGRNCRVCHGVHTSKYVSLVRDKVPYGNWQLATRFEETSTGGTCTTACHPPRSYDRVYPVNLKLGIEVAQRSPRVPIADKGRPVVARFSTRDIRGDEVKSPAVDRPSVLLFLRGDRETVRQVLKMVSAATPQIDGAQVVVVFCGEKAKNLAGDFATTTTVRWPVIADPEYTLSGQLGVEVWPAILVVKNDGVVVAHVGGIPLSLTLDLEAYLDLATNKIDRKTLTRRLAANDLSGGTPVKSAAWYLQMGRNYLYERKTDEARTQFADGLKLHPDSTQLHVELIRTLIELNEAREAMDLLEKLPENAASHWEREVLRGRVLVGLGQWDEARRTAMDLLKERPDLGGAHYIMGMVYQNDREWERAAEEFRAASVNGIR